MKPKLIIESHVPCVPGELSEFFEIERLAPADITPEAVADADALIIRTRTYCNEALLRGSKVKFIATATIGTDHIDLGWCAANGIEVASAPGCNAPAVAQYVMASLISIYQDSLPGRTIGIVGVGHVGCIVADWAGQLGMKVVLCDPPRAAAELDFPHTDIEDLLPQADVVTFHVPHTAGGRYPTHHMADSRLFRQMKNGAVLINSARGPIVNTDDLIAALESGKIRHAVIDCWEGEPDISRKLLQLATIATPHIAGYSLNGKIRATTMAVNALCRFFDVDYTMDSGVPAGAAEKVTPQSIIDSYEPMIDTLALKMALDKPDFPARFESMRNHYPLRPEPKGN